MPVQVVATASPHCAHSRYPQASLALVKGAQEAGRGKEVSPPQAEHGQGRAGCLLPTGLGVHQGFNTQSVGGMQSRWGLARSDPHRSQLSGTGNGNFWSSSTGGSSLNAGGCTFL